MWSFSNRGELDSPLKQYILLPRRGLLAATGSPAHALFADLPAASSVRPPVETTFGADAAHPVRVIDSLRENGPKLVELDEAGFNAANAPESPVRALPVVEYLLPSQMPAAATPPAAATTSFTVQCLERGSGKPLANATINAWNDYAKQNGTN